MCIVSLFSHVLIKISAKGLKSSSISWCLKNANGNRSENMFRCAQTLQKFCLSSRVRVIKTIRTKMNVARTLLEELPNMKIIHLVRDPRAVLQSQSNLGQCNTEQGGIESCTNKLCYSLENNLVEEEFIMRDYPNRIIPVLYEEIAKHPTDIQLEIQWTQSFETVYRLDVTTSSSIINMTLSRTISLYNRLFTHWDCSKNHDLILICVN